MEDVIKYIFEPPQIVEEKGLGGGIVKFITINVTNNIDLPPYFLKMAYDLLWSYPDVDQLDYESNQLKKRFDKGTIYIPGKSYKNQTYPKGGTLKSLYNQDPIAYTFSSIIVDETSQEPLSGVKIKDLDNQKTKSNPDGSFEITGTFSPGKVQKLIFNLKKYGAKTLVISTLDGSIRSDISIIPLNPDTKEIKSSILKAQATSDEQKKKMTEEEKKEFIEQTKAKAMEEIKIRLIPYLIKKLLCEPYGVCDPIGLINKAKAAKEKAKDLNERRKEKKAKKEEEKRLKEEESINGETLT